MFHKRRNHNQKRARIEEKLALIARLRGLSQEQRLRYLDAEIAEAFCTQDSRPFQVILKAIKPRCER